MQNVLTVKQLKEVDAYTIKKLRITSLDLMEIASKAFVSVFKNEVKDQSKSIAIFCGKGNNGADGLAIARLLFGDGYQNILVYLVAVGTSFSDEYLSNLERLKATSVSIKELGIEDDFTKADIIIDAILGAGLNKPLSNELKNLITEINGAQAKVFAVDVPTGLNSEGEIANNYEGIKSDLTITFQQPKINFFFPESGIAQQRFEVVHIGLDKRFIAEQDTCFKIIEAVDVQSILKPRLNFSHKGTYEHAVLVAGNENTMGAAILATNACLHAGAGLSTVCLPQSGLIALNTVLPEAMALPRRANLTAEDFEKFNVLAVGPGLGINEENERLLAMLIDLRKPMVIDADGLTILSKRKDFLLKLPNQTVLTPHVKEFDRIFGNHENWWQRLETAKAEAKKLNVIIVLKNQFTFICLPNGDVLVNMTGNAAMASGGMGDVLTGIITSFLAQSYSVAEAVMLGVYLHGKAGDELAQNQFAVSASQVAEQIPKTMKVCFDFTRNNN
ncbi:MAG: NAD(P)H-hydrate dehydratase [Flavobacterium sp.]|nr:MAG: NAD(P)H-hydrate dehydratase [Flavobacterium sp.]